MSRRRRVIIAFAILSSLAVSAIALAPIAPWMKAPAGAGEARAEANHARPAARP